jgi:hypothetical protein
VRIATDVDDIAAITGSGAFAIVLHMEGADGIDGIEGRGTEVAGEPLFAAGWANAAGASAQRQYRGSEPQDREIVGW